MLISWQLNSLKSQSSCHFPIPSFLSLNLDFNHFHRPSFSQIQLNFIDFITPRLVSRVLHAAHLMNSFKSLPIFSLLIPSFSLSWCHQFINTQYNSSKMSAAVTDSPANNQAARLLLGISPPPSDYHRDPERRESTTSAAGRIRTLLDLLTTEKIDGLDRAMRSNGGGGASRWRTLRERLGFKTAVVSCCGVSTWPFGSSPLVDDEDTSDEENGVVPVGLGYQQQQQEEEDQQARDSLARGMNLAAALAAERELRQPRTPLRRLLTAEKRELELEREKEKEEREDEGLEVGSESESESVCCVCMGRRKGAAMIPCGHTYCRACSREVWLTRGSCPLCNRPILDILDIF